MFFFSHTLSTEGTFMLCLTSVFSSLSWASQSRALVGEGTSLRYMGKNDRDEARSS
jgi:hypothetical protein